MKKTLGMLLALVVFLTFGSFVMQHEAQAEEVQFELLGKVGGTSSTFDKASLGDPIFDVSGGLDFSVLFRFPVGVGIGLNLNWTMATQRLERTKLTYALEAKKREVVTQYPSIGLALRYQAGGIFDLGLWMNYGFGSVDIDYNNMNGAVASAFGLKNANLSWDLQTFELGIMGAFAYRIEKINLDVMFGLQAYIDFSRMLADDSTLENARDIHGRALDENSVYAGGFAVVFGARYDLIFGNKSKKKKRK